MNAATRTERRQLAGSFWLQVAIVLGVLLLAECATIASGTKQQVTIQSSPSDALVKVDGKPLGRTPLTLQLDKKEKQTLTVEKEDYKTFSTKMSTTLDPWFWGNILFGGLIGTTTDGMSGAIHKYEPNQYIVTLEPVDASRIGASVAKAPMDQAREFIILSYRNLTADLAKGEGDYLDSLTKLLNVPDEQRPQALAKLRGLEAAYTTIPEFADRTVAMFLQEAPMAASVDSPKPGVAGVDDGKTRIGLIPGRLSGVTRYNPTRDVPTALQRFEARFPKLKVELLPDGERHDAAGNAVKVDALWSKPSIFSRPEPDRPAVLLAAKALELDFAVTYYWQALGFGEQGRMTMYVFDVKRELVYEEQFDFELQSGGETRAAEQIESNLEELFRQHRLFEET
jgi:hypothetical protein